MHNLVQNQPNLVAMNQTQSIKPMHNAQDPCFYLGLCVVKKKKKKEPTHCFGPYILGSKSIWSLHFGNNQFDLCYFQLTINLVFTVNSLTEKSLYEKWVHVANLKLMWLIKYSNNKKKN